MAPNDTPTSSPATQASGSPDGNIPDLVETLPEARTHSAVKTHRVYGRPFQVNPTSNQAEDEEMRVQELQKECQAIEDARYARALGRREAVH